jgi:hypothetical protein
MFLLSLWTVTLWLAINSFHLCIHWLGQHFVVYPQRLEAFIVIRVLKYRTLLLLLFVGALTVLLERFHHFEVVLLRLWCSLFSAASLELHDLLEWLFLHRVTFGVSSCCQQFRVNRVYLDLVIYWGDFRRPWLLLVLGLHLIRQVIILIESMLIAYVLFILYGILLMLHSMLMLIIVEWYLIWFVVVLLAAIATRAHVLETSCEVMLLLEIYRVLH